MKTRVYLLVAMSLVGLWTSGCSAVGKSAQPMLLQATSFQICPWKPGEAGLQVIRKAADWQQFLAPAQQDLSKMRQWKPSFEKNQRVFVYRLGQKNSAGFSVSLGMPSLSPDNQLRLPLKLNAPAADSMNAMVLTSPCTVGLVEISSATSIELVDDSTKAVITTAQL